jgi:hypothetical protein
MDLSQQTISPPFHDQNIDLFVVAAKDAYFSYKFAHEVKASIRGNSSTVYAGWVTQKEGYLFPLLAKTNTPISEPEGFLHRSNKPRSRAQNEGKLNESRQLLIGSSAFFIVSQHD